MPTKLLDQRIKNIARSTGCIVSKNQEKFNLSFNIRNLNLIKYRLEFKSFEYEMMATCEVLEGTSDKPTYFSGNTPIQNKYSIICIYNEKNILPFFSIYESGFFRKLFLNETIRVKCNNDELKDYINGLFELDLLKERINNSAEISPEIICKKVKNKNQLSIFFQSYTVEFDLFEAMIELVRKINIKLH